MGWRVTIAARRFEQAAKLADDLYSSTRPAQVNAIYLAAQAGRHPSIFDLAPGFNPMTGLDLVVNATPAGMFSHEEENAWPEALPLPVGAFIYDMVYVPRETAMVRRARLAGLGAANGSGMLVEQAAAAFELWTGRKAPRGVMRRAFFQNLSPELKDRS